MSLFFAFVLILVAGLISGVIDGMAHIWHPFAVLIAILPLWLKGAIVIGCLSWFVGEPRA